MGNNESTAYTMADHSPPSSTDKLAQDFGIAVWHGRELLKKMLTAKLITNEQVKSIFEALELNGDLTETWRQAKHITFLKLFGKG